MTYTDNVAEHYFGIDDVNGLANFEWRQFNFLC